MGRLFMVWLDEFLLHARVYLVGALEEKIAKMNGEDLEKLVNAVRDCVREHPNYTFYLYYGGRPLLDEAAERCLRDILKRWK